VLAVPVRGDPLVPVAPIELLEPAIVLARRECRDVIDDAVVRGSISLSVTRGLLAELIARLHVALS
jgi:hypothetical protein